jgi:predicted dehydrogenase
MNPFSRRDFLKKAGVGAAVLGSNPHLGSAEPAGAAHETKPLGYAVVGIGRLTKHEVIPAFKNTKHSRLTGLVSGDREKALRFARQYGVPEKNIYNYKNYDAMASNPEIDAVYNALPNSMHAEYTIRAAKAGKHVLCEKPMANSVGECEEMIAACRQADRRLMIAYRLQYEANHLEAVRLVRSGEFGTLKFIDAQLAFVIGDPKQWRLNKKMAGGGSLMDIGVYCLQAARYLSGQEPVRVTAHAWSTDPVKYREVEENITFTLLFPGGLAANCYCSYGMAGLNGFRAVGPSGWVEMSPAYPYRGLRLRVGKEGSVEDRTLPAQDHFATEIDQLSEDVRAGRNPKASGEMGLQDLKIMMAIYRAAETGNQVAIS